MGHPLWTLPHPHEYPDVKRALTGDLASFCDLLGAYILSFVDKNRQHLTNMQKYTLHTAGIDAARLLAWSSKLSSAFQWHRRSQEKTQQQVLASRGQGY
jgi:hypothetical protein